MDTIVAFYTNKKNHNLRGRCYEHLPSMLIEKGRKVYFGTINGVVYCVDPVSQKMVWSLKLIIPW
jgi:hypothetical protein